MRLYLDGSESGLRPQQLPLEDTDLTLIDLTESWAAFVPVITQNRLRPVNQPHPPVTLYVTQELHYNTVCITQLYGLYRLKCKHCHVG